LIILSEFLFLIFKSSGGTLKIQASNVFALISSKNVRMYTVINCQHARVSTNYDTQTCENGTFASEIHTYVCRFLHTHECDFNTNECNFHMLEYDFYTHESDFDTFESSSVISTRMGVKSTHLVLFSFTHLLNRHANFYDITLDG
jgi:hypothetical protein